VKSSVRILAVLAAVALVIAACGSKPKSSSSSSSSSKSSNAGASFKACLVTDTGGIDDRSFNASAYTGIKDAATAGGVTPKFLQSQQASDYPNNINAFIQQKCGIIVTVGFLMGDATEKAANANHDQKFAIVDFSYSKPLQNVKALIYNTAQAGFQGGYLAAGMSKTGKVATFGGQKLPTVTIYMDGFWDGVQYYNSKHHTDVKVLGWDEKSQNGSFTNDFTDQTKGKQVTEQFMQQGADDIFPVAGNVGLGAAAAVKADGNGKVNMLWVDTDGCISAPQYCSLFISSVVKGIAPSVKQATVAAKNGSFTGSNYVGTLKNGGVGIAPYHDFASKVPAALQKEVAQVKSQIIAGKIQVTSPSAPSN
jgi:basic membrane protein A